MGFDADAARAALAARGGDVARAAEVCHADVCPRQVRLASRLLREESLSRGRGVSRWRVPRQDRVASRPGGTVARARFSLLSASS